MSIDREMMDKMERFRSLVEYQYNEELKVKCPNVSREAVKLILGLKYARVDIGHSGKYMVDLATKGIYGIKGYGVINRSQHWGNLDTVNEWYWGSYWPIKASINSCDYGHQTPEQVRVLPMGAGGNLIVCRGHYAVEAKGREDCPRWEELKVYGAE